MSRRAAFRAGLVLLVPLLLFVLLAYGIPFFGVVEWSVTEPEFGFTQYVRLTEDPLVLSVFVRTFRICAVVTVNMLLWSHEKRLHARLTR